MECKPELDDIFAEPAVCDDSPDTSGSLKITRLKEKIATTRHQLQLENKRGRQLEVELKKIDEIIQKAETVYGIPADLF